jgi:hypothetical protein
MNFNEQLVDGITELDQAMNTISINMSQYTLNKCEESIIWAKNQTTSITETIALLNYAKTRLGQLSVNLTGKKQLLISIEEEQIKNPPPVPAVPNASCKTIDDLCTKIENPHQVAIINRIITDKEYSKIYLSGYNPNTETTGKKKNLIGTVKVLGTFSEKKQAREEYEIRLHKDEPKGMFWCSCSDHKFNSTKKNIVCKHICFLICKIGKFLKPDIFANKKLCEVDLTALLAKLTSSNIWSDQTIAKILDKITLSTFKQFDKAIDDCCPVCWNDLTDEDKPNLLSCPTCKNYIHSECADIWLEEKSTCATCRSTYWAYYEKVKSGGSVSVKN